MEYSPLENNELNAIFLLFFDELPCRYEIRCTSRGDTDFRETIIAHRSSGERYVLKLSDNDFTFPEKIAIWKRWKGSVHYGNCSFSGK